MTEAVHGQVLFYSYLWAREYDRGEENGRKARPTCVMLIVTRENGRRATLLFPITSQPPRPGASAVSVPETEARRAKLRTPAWVIVDEFNTDDLSVSFSVEASAPLGIFSRAFMSRVAAKAAEAVRAEASQAVPRR